MCTKEPDEYLDILKLFDEESIQRAHEASIRREGRAGGIAKSILALYTKGFAVEQIAELLDLPVKEVAECVRKNRMDI